MYSGLKEIKINEIENFKIGHAQNVEAATGCSVIICEKGAITGVDIRGGGPASRESALLNPLAANNGVHAVLLSGGSAFGLDAAGGVMKYLEERGIGFPVGDVRVPIVCESCLYDLGFVTSKVRPDIAMGYLACENAEKNETLHGNVGAGTGATVGKLFGGKGMMKAGLGVYALQLGELKVGAIVAVNALGDVVDYENGKIIAGLLGDDGDFLNSEDMLYHFFISMSLQEGANTTIGAIITNAALTKSEMTKVASMTHNAYAKSIQPVHTTADGDSIYAMSCGSVKSDVNVVGTLAVRCMCEAIRDAALSCEGMHGLKCAKDCKEF